MPRAHVTTLAVAVPAMLVALAAAPPLAAAQDADRTAAARALFTDGVALAREHRFAEAADRFRRAHALRPAPAIAWNLATALAELGELVEASEVLERMLRDDATSRDLRARAQRLRDELAPRVARLEIVLEGSADDVAVELDGARVASAAIGVAIPIDPGRHDVIARRDDGGEEVARRAIELTEGERRQVTLSVPPRATRAVPPPLAPVALRVDAPSEAPPASTEDGGDDGVVIGVTVAAAIAVVAGVVVASVLFTMPNDPTPVSGNAMPGVLRW